MKVKLRECFNKTVKYLKKSNFIFTFNLASFFREWRLKKFEDENEEFDIEEVSDFIHQYLSKKDE